MGKKAYHGGAFFSAIGEDFSTLEKADKIISADVLDAWYDPAPTVIQKVKQHLAFSLKTSPPTHAEGLIDGIAKARGIPAANILVSGGSSDLMFTLFPRLLKRSDKVLILDPMYGEYAHIFLNVLGVKLIRHALSPNNSFKVDFDMLLQEVRRTKPNLIVMVNPNSPTGEHGSKIKIENFIRQLPKKTVVVVDETYIDYVGARHSLEKSVLKYSNLIIIKSMSKIYALSGARVGYLVLPTSIKNKVEAFIPPWSVSLIAQIAGVEALKAKTYYQKQYTQTHALREQMIAAIKKLPVARVFNSTANFFLIELAQPGPNAQFIVEKLRKQNIFLRNCGSMSPQFKNRFIRIAVKDKKTNERVIQSLGKALKK